MHYEPPVQHIKEFPVYVVSYKAFGEMVCAFVIRQLYEAQQEVFRLGCIVRTQPST